MLHAARLPLVLLAAAALLAGLHAGLQRVGWIEFSGELALWHGPLMATGFFATLIGLERAVALGERWLYAAPALSGASGVASMVAPGHSFAALLAVAGAAILSVGAAVAFWRHRALFMATLATGVFALFAANLLWLVDGLSPSVALWWVGFLVLVIAGERLELSRVLQHGPLIDSLFVVAAAMIVAGLVALIYDEFGHALLGLGLLALTAWLCVFDVARRTRRGRGLTRYMAYALLAGYGWLGFAGALLLLADPIGGFRYDAILHALFVGFAFSMVFAHAAVIFPAVIGIEMPYSRFFYLPLVLLHLSLALRFAADALERPDERSLAGALNAAAILLFFLLLLGSAVAAHRRRRVKARRPLPEGLTS